MNKKGLAGFVESSEIFSVLILDKIESLPKSWKSGENWFPSSVLPWVTLFKVHLRTLDFRYSADNSDKVIIVLSTAVITLSLSLALLNGVRMV